MLVGDVPAGNDASVGRERLDRCLAALVPVAEEAGVVLAVEPEPGMLVERVGDVVALAGRLGNPEALGLTIDVGHLVCTEDEAPGAVVRGARDLLVNVQIDDMRRGVHEHLPFGEGEVDLPEVLAALTDTGYDGLVHVELPRHSHAAPVLAEQALAALRAGSATPTGSRGGPDMGWCDDARRAVAADGEAVLGLFPAAARHARAEGRDGTQVRGELLTALPGSAADVASLVTTLYRRGDAVEKHAVLVALPALDRHTAVREPLGGALVPLVLDALRTNDTRLVAAALGGYAAQHLDDAAWRQGVVKAIFTGVPLARVAGLEERTDDELRRMVRDLADERRAAGRDVPADARLVVPDLDRTDPALARSTATPGSPR